MALTPGDTNYQAYVNRICYTKTQLDSGVLDARYFTESEFVSVSAGVSSAGKPVKLNSSGLVDATMMVGGSVATHAALTAAHGATGAIVGTTNSQTLTNKTLTAPVISTITNTGTLTLPTSTDTLVGRATTDTLTNKTLTTPAIANFTNATHDHSNVAGGAVLNHANLTASGTYAHSTIDGHLDSTVQHGASGAVVGTTNSQTLTNKTLTDPIISRVYGGSGASDDLTLEPTSNGTKTTSYVAIAPSGGKTIAGGSTADHRFEVQDAGASNYRVTVNLNSSGKNYINSYSTAPGTTTGAPLYLFGSGIFIDTGRLNVGINSAPTSGVTPGTAGDLIVTTTKIWFCTDGSNTWKGVTIA